MGQRRAHGYAMASSAKVAALVGIANMRIDMLEPKNFEVLTGRPRSPYATGAQDFSMHSTFGRLKFKLTLQVNLEAAGDLSS